MEQWKSTPTIEDITSVPGVGPATAKVLAETDDGNDKVVTTYQLFGKYLMLKGPDMSPMEHTERFWYWLKNRGVNAHRSAIVRAVSLIGAVAQ